MARPKLITPSVQIKAYLSADVAAKLEILVFDDSRGKPQYGARSELINRLLRYWIGASGHAQESQLKLDAARSADDLLDLALETLDRSPAYNRLAAAIRTQRALLESD